MIRSTMMAPRRSLLLASLLAAGGAQAQDGWPGRRPIRLVTGFAPGGLADTIARLVAPALGDALGATVVVENRVGASGTLGADVVAKAAPDGFTLAISHAIPFGFAQGVLPSLPYDPVADFTHLAMLAEAPTVIVVSAASPHRTLVGMLQAARARPVQYGSAGGVGSAEHVVGAVVARAAGATQLEHIPYRSTPQVIQDLLAGHVDAANAPITPIVGQLRDGSLRLLATSTEARLPGFPDAPTLAELGYGQATHTQWIGLSAPRNLPAPIRDRLVAVVPSIVAQPGIQARLADFASLPRSPALAGSEFARFVATFRDHWVALARAEGIVAS